MKSSLICAACLLLVASHPLVAGEKKNPLQAKLAQLPYQIVSEAYDSDNWELFSMAADGSGRKNLTKTKDSHELYPQASPDGKRICFVSDSGEGRSTVRSVCVMNADGSDRRTVAEYARQPFWSADSKTIGYLPQEYKKFAVVDYFTKGMKFYDIDSGKTRDHPNAEKLHHLYNPSFSADGKWIASTVHAGMGFSHAILLIEANGKRIFDLKLKGCRPCLSPDGKKIAWGEDDRIIVVAEFDLEADVPKAGKRLLEIVDPKDKIYHCDWAPDSAHLAFSKGTPSKGDISKHGTHESACEIVGVYAAGWDVIVVPVPESDSTERLDLSKAPAGSFAKITNTGLSNKEPEWLNKAPAKSAK